VEEYSQRSTLSAGAKLELLVQCDAWESVNNEKGYQAGLANAQEMAKRQAEYDRRVAMPKPPLPVQQMSPQAQPDFDLSNERRFCRICNQTVKPIERRVAGSASQ
jgi:hypothetical protein